MQGRRDTEGHKKGTQWGKMAMEDAGQLGHGWQYGPMGQGQK